MYFSVRKNESNDTNVFSRNFEIRLSSISFYFVRMRNLVIVSLYIRYMFNTKIYIIKIYFITWYFMYYSIFEKRNSII